MAKCEQCNREFTRKYDKEDPCRFCSLPCYWESKKGQYQQHLKSHYDNPPTPWNKGLKYSASHKGRKNPWQAGEKHWNWKGGISSQDKLERLRFRETIMLEVLARDGYACVLCGQNGDLQVDHIKSWANFPELRFNLENCQTLCMSCHYEKTFNRKLPQGVVWGHNLSRRVTS